MRFWVFECMFVVNNNLQMDEVFVGGTRKSVIAAMKKFFKVPRAKILAAEVLGMYCVDEGEATAYYDVMPFVEIDIADDQLSFDHETQERLLGDMQGGGLSREFLRKGRAMAEDAEEDDEDDDEDPELRAFHFHFDADGLLAKLPNTDGTTLAADAKLQLVRPLGVPGWPDNIDETVFTGPVTVGPGWSDALPHEKAYAFDSVERFTRDLELPIA